MGPEHPSARAERHRSDAENPPKIKKGMVPVGNHPLEISQLIPNRKDPG